VISNNYIKANTHLYIVQFFCKLQGNKKKNWNFLKVLALVHMVVATMQHYNGQLFPIGWNS
jgi:uncharacterized Tic20 family protein